VAHDQITARWLEKGTEVKWRDHIFELAATGLRLESRADQGTLLRLMRAADLRSDTQVEKPLLISPAFASGLGSLTRTDDAGLRAPVIADGLRSETSIDTTRLIAPAIAAGLRTTPRTDAAVGIAPGFTNELRSQTRVSTTFLGVRWLKSDYDRPDYAFAETTLG